LKSLVPKFAGVPNAERIRLLDCLWVRGARIDRPRNSRSEREALQACGAQIHVLEHERDQAGLDALRKLLFKSDRHVVLARLLAKELKALQPLLRERGNFSIVMDDWWSSPYWFTRHATYLLFRNYNGLAVRTGLCPLAQARQAPLCPVPETWSVYGAAGAVLRLPALAASPLLEAWNWYRRQVESIPRERLIYFPFPVAERDVPPGREPVDIDFSNLGGTYGIWFMRDPHASPLLNFTNLYHDRKLIADALARFRDHPYKVFDWRRDRCERPAPEHCAPARGAGAEPKARNPLAIPFEEYCSFVRRSRYTVATGGLHHTSVPKLLEFACLGTPMLGRRLPYEYPWLTECMFPIDPLGAGPERMKRQLDDALAQYPRYREQCLALRDRLLRQYHLAQVLAVAQAQIDGRPVPPGYVVEPPPAANEAAARPAPLAQHRPA
jgi:hypothetical protein